VGRQKAFCTKAVTAILQSAQREGKKIFAENVGDNILAALKIWMPIGCHPIPKAEAALRNDLKTNPRPFVSNHNVLLF